MAAGTFTLYNNMAGYGWLGVVNLATDTLAVTLHTSAYTPSGAHDVYADLTNELATANGYTNGGATITGVVNTNSGGVFEFDCDDQVWTASGGDITARYAVVRSTTADKLLGYMLLDNSPADITATDGNTITVSPSAADGWFQSTVNA